MGLKIIPSAIQRAWRAYGVKPWKAESFRFSTELEPAGKVTDICGLYLAPPRNAIVLCVDEKSQIQSLDRTVPILLRQEGRCPSCSGKRADRTPLHDFCRHGTSTLFAALDIASGQVTAALKQRHRYQEFLTFFKQLERTYRHTLDADGDRASCTWSGLDHYAAPSARTSARGSLSTLGSSCTSP